MVVILTFSLSGYGQDTLRTKTGWDMNLSGYINSNYILEFTENVDGSIHSIQNGLLPAALTFSASKVVSGWTVTPTFGIFYGLSSNQALAFSQVDARQVFFTASKPTSGTFTVGRNFGLFGFDAIIADFSLLGVGAGFLPQSPGLTTLGGIAYGYYYCDRLNQINYTTPDFGGFTATVGLYQGLDALLTDVSNDPSRPGIHGKLAYASDGFTASTSFINQASLTATGREVNATGFDVFAKVTAVEHLELVGYFSSGSGLEDVLLGTAILSDGGNEYSTNTFYVQGSYAFGANTLAVYYGQSSNTDLNDNNTRLSFHYRRAAFGAALFNVGFHLLGGSSDDVDKAGKTQLNAGFFLPF
nr:porin [Flavilitoribacter nigricans]